MPYLKKNRFFDKEFACDEKDYKTLIKLIEQRQDKGNFMGAIPLNDWSLESATRINLHFKLPSLSLESVEKSRNKHKMKECFKKASLPVAKSFFAFR